MKKYLIVWLCFSFVYVTGAQHDSSLLYVTHNGNVYRIFPDRQQLDQIRDTGYVHQLVHAPIGNRIAFVEHAINGDPFNADPYNYAYSADFEGDTLYILENGEFHKLNATPTNILASPYLQASDPTWSSDGDRLAWTTGVILEDNGLGYFVDDAHLQYFDFQDEQTHRLNRDNENAYLLPDTGSSVLVSPTWTAHYVATLYGGFPQIIMRLDTIISYQDTTRLTITNSEYPISVDIVDVWTEDGSSIGVFYKQFNQWDLLNPLTLYSEALDTVLELVSPNAPETSLRWRYDGIAGEWQLFNTSNSLLHSVSASFSRQPITLSPDGKSAAFIENQTVVLIGQDSHTDRITSLDNAHGLAWGPMQWRISNYQMSNRDQQTYFAETDCSENTISVGSFGTFDQAFDFYAHNEPLRYLMHTLPAETPVTIFNDARCRYLSDGSLAETLWQVEADGLQGWIVVDNRPVFTEIK